MLNIEDENEGKIYTFSHAGEKLGSGNEIKSQKLRKAIQREHGMALGANEINH